MNILKIFEDLQSFVVSLRRGGTTTLIKKIAEENDVWVLVADLHHAKEFGDKAITLQQLGEEKAKGRFPKPILIDNHTLLVMTDEVIHEVIHLKNKIKERDKVLESIKEQIQMFELLNGQIETRYNRVARKP